MLPDLCCGPHTMLLPHPSLPCLRLLLLLPLLLLVCVPQYGPVPCVINLAARLHVAQGVTRRLGQAVLEQLKQEGKVSGPLGLVAGIGFGASLVCGMILMHVGG